MSLLGKAIYKLYFQPRNTRAYIKKFGGKKSYFEMLAAEREMRSYALEDLIIENNFNIDGRFRLNFLTGEKFIHQTLFCTYSFFKFLTPEESNHFSVHYYSDGTLDESIIKTLNRRFPQISVIGSDQTKSALERHLPKSLYPNLNKKIDSLPLFKKLIYPHLGNKGLAVFLDSDMLFLKKPESFLNWLHAQERSQDHTFGIRDTVRSYGYTDQEILSVWPSGLKNDINSGMYAVLSENMDLPFIENLVKEFEKKFGAQYYLEQLITAIILEKSGKLFVAPNSEYIVLPSPEQIKNQIGTLHHYVNESKDLYFKLSWKKQLPQ